MCLQAGELATLSFYILTGIKFRPAPQNPYLSLEMSDYLDDESREILERERELQARDGKGGPPRLFRLPTEPVLSLV